MELWVSDRIRGRFDRPASALLSSSNQRITIRVAIDEDMNAALAAFAKWCRFDPDRIGVTIMHIVRAWLIRCPQKFVLPALPFSDSLHDWVVRSIEAADSAWRAQRTPNPVPVQRPQRARASGETFRVLPPPDQDAVNQSIIRLNDYLD